MHQVHIGAAQRHQQHAERQRDQIEGRHRARVLALHRRRATPAPAAAPRRAARRSSRRSSSARSAGRRAGSPAAAPGRMAWAMASPVRLMRRSIRNTPTGPGADRQHQRAPSERPLHEAEFDEGGEIDIQYGRINATVRACSGPWLGARARARPRPRACARAFCEILGPQSPPVAPPGHRLARHQQRAAENAAAPVRYHAARQSTVRPSRMPMRRRGRVRSPHGAARRSP